MTIEEMEAKVHKEIGEVKQLFQDRKIGWDRKAESKLIRLLASADLTNGARSELGRTALYRIVLALHGERD